VITNSIREASGSCLDDDPAALAVAEQPNWEAGPTVGFEDGEPGEKVVRLLADPGVQPASGRAADSPLVERAHSDSCLEQVLPDRREEHVVVPVRRTGAWMHEHTGHCWARRAPDRPGEANPARVGLDLERRRQAVVAGHDCHRR
jgi:hypothetical protein